MSSIRRAFLQELGGGRVGPETASLVAGLRARGVPTELFTEKRLRRRQLPIAHDTLVAGEIPVVQQALRQLGIEVPEPDDYPACLSPLLHRRTWESTVGRVTDDVLEGGAGAVFVKPKGKLKRFTGYVLAGLDDLRNFEGASRQTAVFCSEVVAWRSEWRIYVIRGAIVAKKIYTGDAKASIDDSIVANAVSELGRAGKAPSAYGIDFGVLETGETALVELNDGYGLGSYELEDDIYTELIVTRWIELAESRLRPGT